MSKVLRGRGSITKEKEVGLLKKKLLEMKESLLEDIEKTHEHYPEWVEYFRPICLVNGKLTVGPSTKEVPKCLEGELVGYIHTHPKDDVISISPWDIELHILDDLRIRYLCVLNKHPRTKVPYAKCYSFKTVEEAELAMDRLLDCHLYAERVRERISPLHGSIAYDACAQRMVRPIFKLRLI